MKNLQLRLGVALSKVFVTLRLERLGVLELSLAGVLLLFLCQSTHLPMLRNASIAATVPYVPNRAPGNSELNGDMRSRLPIVEFIPYFVNV